ncbi:hypothetical protein PN36_06815 [Candidatus Thiomargarita nelsonii]|uniref:Uncharacterized protein n=1 Tax=Candidatus Thiomargarita nelsonii TaxID=1003181 RepID=A0A0A6S121_9GAMM|nr:hypothetical protein PN36_06815 [Candidatus Thiomargarita nelsonii]
MSNNFYQEDDLWQALQAQTDLKKQRYQLVEMAHLLLKRARINPDDIAQLDYDDITDLLLEYQGTAEQTDNFFQQALPFIDPEYKGQAFEQQLQTLQQTLSDTRAEITRFSEQNTRLSEQKNQLDKEVECLTELKPQVETLEQNISQLKEQVEALRQHEERLKQLADEPFHQEAITTVIESIPNIVALIKANQEIFQNHLAENARIGEAMQEIADHTDKMATLSKNMSASLQEFDRELQRVIEIGEKQTNN